jgi:hypothetical protein
MSVQLTIAVISGAVALISILLSTRNARSTAVLEARLQSELEQRREQADKALRVEQVVNRYRDPLLSAAFDLQSRIYNILILGFSGYLNSGNEDEKNYAVNSTLFLIAQYFGWTEALRRGVQFLDLGEVERNRELVRRMENIRGTFSTDTRVHGPFRIFRAQQRAMGELMHEKAEDRSGSMLWQCRGYASFCSLRTNDPAFATWFARLDHDVRELATNPEPAYARLVAVQNVLIDLIDFLDNPPMRVPLKSRSKITLEMLL